MSKQELIEMILEQRQMILNKGLLGKNDSNEILVMMVLIDSLLAQLVEGKKVA